MGWVIRTAQNGSGELTHHGILGMKWGVRRTPEQLGHKKAEKALKAQTSLAKYKTQKVAKINKLYDKSIKRIEDGLEYDPGNKDLTKELKSLKKLRDQDVKSVESMSYTDVVNEKAAIKKARNEKIAKVATGVAKGTMTATLWGAKMGLVGVKAYGLFKGAQLLGELGSNAVEWLQSPDGQAFINKGFNVVNAFVSAGDMVVKVSNADIADYVDTKSLADKITTEAINYGKSEIDKQIRRVT